MKPLYVLAALLAAAPALAQESPTPKPDPAPAPKTGEPAPKGDVGTKVDGKKERTTSPEAEAALKRYGDLLAFPPKAVQKIRLKIDADIPQAGMIKMDYTWERDKEAKVEVELPDSLKQQIPPEYQDQVKKQMSSQLAGQMFEDVTKQFSQYNLASKVDAGKTTVDITPMSDTARFEKGTLFFDADGLLAKQVVTIHADPNNPQTAMMAGAELETTYKYVKSGNGYVLESQTQSTPMGEIATNFSYYDVKDQPKLLKQIDMANPMGQITITVHDYAIDGKDVAGTEKAEAKKAEKPAAPGGNETAPPAPKDPK